MALTASLAPTVRRRRRLSLVVAGLIVAIVAAGCGGSGTGSGSGGGGGGGGNGNYDKVIAESQAAFGNTMLSGTVEGDTLKITLADGAGPGMAKLFLCSNIRGFLKDAGLAGSKVVIVEQSGAQLATEKDC